MTCVQDTQVVSGISEGIIFLQGTIVQLHDTRNWTSVLLVINVAQGYKYRTFDFFIINRNFLISFLSSFVTLTVFLFNLSPKS